MMFSMLLLLAINGSEATDRSPPFDYLYANAWKDNLDELIKNKYSPKKVLKMIKDGKKVVATKSS